MARNLEPVLKEFNALVQKTIFLVAHNISFDMKIIGAELLRKDSTNLLQQKMKICTMKTATNYCKLPGKYGRYKWPNLTELHTKLFGKKFKEAHDASVDIDATEKCFWEMKRIGVI
jgi:DNA polymerase III alpha subunit (gram-positive type)